MSSIHTVAIAGANGSLGKVVLQKLLEAGFEVTALSRAAGKVPAQAHLTEVVVDYEDHAAVVAALKGKDAVISTISTASLAAQKDLIEAAAEAGVKRFIPSEFGSNLEVPEVRALPVYRDKVAIHDLLAAKAKETQLTYTMVQNNAFLDWGIEHGFVIDPVKHKAAYFDGGDHLVTFTRLSAVGHGVVGVLKHPEETKNRVVYIQEAALSFKTIVKIIQEFAPGNTWTTPVVDTKEKKDKALEALSKGVFEQWVFFDQLIWAAMSKGQTGNYFEKNDNELLGVKQLNDQEVKEAIKEVLERIPGAL